MCCLVNRVRLHAVLGQTQGQNADTPKAHSVPVVKTFYIYSRGPIATQTLAACAPLAGPVIIAAVQIARPVARASL